MKISRELRKYADNLDKIAIDIVNETLEYAWEEVVNKAPMDTGEYVSSIQIERAKKDGNVIRGKVFSDMIVTTKAGDSYQLASLLENGTRPHLIRPVDANYLHFYIGEKEIFTKLVHHPGFLPMPHWQPAYDKASIKIDELIKEKL